MENETVPRQRDREALLREIDRALRAATTRELEKILRLITGK